MKQAVLSRIREMTGMESAAVTARGNAAILYALFVVKKKNNKSIVAIPDQGGWLTFKTYPPLLGFRVVEYPTKDGICDLEYLRKNVLKFACIIVENPAGYNGRQPMEDIFRICDGKTYVVEDVSGSMGSYNSPSHIKVASFGEGKPINVGLGGCIATSAESMDAIKDVFSITRIEDDVYERIMDKLEDLPRRYEQLYARVGLIKHDLISFDVVPGEGLVAIVRYKNDEEKSALIRYCHEQDLPFTDCPRYIRLMDRAICIEVKRL